MSSPAAPSFHVMLEKYEQLGQSEFILWLFRSGTVANTEIPAVISVMRLIAEMKKSNPDMAAKMMREMDDKSGAGTFTQRGEERRGDDEKRVRKKKEKVK